ncbi:alpha/beta hydrolase [Chitinophaga pollutisoli]|uniref:Alpha/beta hydrolase n=1 Tax=Chitinophaga pollutisoli TaxID=3133966 RepID=A0ABZ2YU19_9BACT
MEKQIFNRSVSVDGVEIFYREAGNRRRPSLLLMHGFPSSSLMFKNLMTALADRYHLIAPDYPGFGFSGFPAQQDFQYTFQNIASHISRFTDRIGLSHFAIYLHDYGCPIGLRVCLNQPGKISALIVQDGNAYAEGIGPQWDETIDYWNHPTPEKKEKVAGFLSEEGTRMQYTAGVPEALLERISPELWRFDWLRMQRPGNIDMQFALNCDFQDNIGMFPVFQQYFRTHQPPALILWGKHDVFFGAEEARCYPRDLRDTTVHILNGGHKLLETNFDEVLSLVSDFLERKVST